MDAQTDLSNWVASIPKITRWWFFAFFILPLTTRLGLLNPMYLVLLPEPALSGFQVCASTCQAASPAPVGFNCLCMT